METRTGVQQEEMGGNEQELEEMGKRGQIHQREEKGAERWKGIQLEKQG